VPVSIENQNLRPKIIKKSGNLKYLKKHSKSNVLNAYSNMLVLVYLKKIFCSGFFGCWVLASLYFLGWFHGNAHRGGVK